VDQRQNLAVRKQQNGLHKALNLTTVMIAMCTNAHTVKTGTYQAMSNKRFLKAIAIAVLLSCPVWVLIVLSIAYLVR